MMRSEPPVPGFLPGDAPWSASGPHEATELGLDGARRVGHAFDDQTQEGAEQARRHAPGVAAGPCGGLGPAAVPARRIVREAAERAWRSFET